MPVRKVEVSSFWAIHNKRISIFEKRKKDRKHRFWILQYKGLSISFSNNCKHLPCLKSHEKIIYWNLEYRLDPGGKMSIQKRIRFLLLIFLFTLFSTTCSNQENITQQDTQIEPPAVTASDLSLTADVNTLCVGAKTKLAIQSDEEMGETAVEWRAGYGSITGNGLEVVYNTPEEVSQEGVDKVEAVLTYDGNIETLSTYILILEKETSSAWVQTNGPSGGIINVIEIDQQNSNILYGAGNGGMVYKTENGGEQWRALPKITEENDTISEILLGKGNTQMVYALAWGGFFKSADGGESWTRIEGEAGQCPTAAAMHPKDDNFLAIGDCGGNVFTSENAGQNWKKIGSSVTAGRYINNIAVATKDTIWLSYQDDTSGELFRTVNEGISWEQIDTGKPDDMRIYTIYVDEENSDAVYVGVMNVHNEPLSGEEDYPLYVSRNGGNSWKAITSIERSWLDSHLAVIGKQGEGRPLFIATHGRIAKSYDEGETWEHLNPPQPSGDIYDLAVDPNNPDVIYVPRRSTGIIKSVDGGQTFSPINKGLLNVGVTLLAVPEIEGSGSVYAVATTGEGAFRSMDYGVTWENVTDGGITHPWPDELTISPFDPAEIWFTGDVPMVFKSTDYGENWDVTVYRDNQGFRYGTTSAMAVSHSNPDIIYALKNGFGIFKYDPSEYWTWQFLHQSGVDYTYTLAIHPDNPDIIFSGYNSKPFEDSAMVRRSMDGGQSWETVLTVEGSYGITSVIFDQNNPAIMYAGSTAKGEDGGGRIFRSMDGGNTWQDLNSYFIMNTIWGQPQLIVHPDDPSTAYAATWLAGTWKTTDAGANWTLLDNAPISATSLSIDTQEPEVIYLADRAAPLLWKSLDGGKNWETIIDFSDNGAFLVNRVFAYGGTVFVSTFGPGIHGGGLYKSYDGGRTWTDISGDLPRSVLDIVVHPEKPDTIYVTTHIYGAYRSDDGGENWAELSGYPNIGGYDIEIDPENPNVLYTAGMGGMKVPDWVMQPDGYQFTEPSGVYKSTDGGTTWTQLLETSNESRAVRLHPENSDIVFTAALDDGLQVSMDGGATWQQYNNGLDTTVLTSVAIMGDKVYTGTQGFGVYGGNFDPASGSITWARERGNKPVPTVYNLKIKCDPINPERIYVGSNPGGLFRSDDGGKTFYDKNFQTPSVVVDDPIRQGYYTFAINPENPEEVWVGTWGKGIYKSYDGMDFDAPAFGEGELYGKHINDILISRTYGVVVATEEGVYRSTDDGAGWKEFSEGLLTSQVRSIVETPDGRLLCGTAGYEIFERDAHSDWSQFQDFGNFGTFWPIWDNRPMYQYTSVLFHPSDPDIVMLGTFPAGIFISRDGGETWLESNTGWTNDGVFSLIYHPLDENIVYSGTYNGVNRSLDGGEHWEMWDEGWPDEQWVFSIDFDPGDPDVIYACSKNGANMGRGVENFHGTVMKSTDGGATWFAITDGLDVSQEFYKIIVDRFDPQTVYLATQYDGVYISYNGGGDWSPWSEGLTSLYAGTNGNNVTNTMVLSEDGLHLYFGSAGSGVFRRLTAYAASKCGCQSGQ